MDELKRCSKCKQEKAATLEFFGAEKRRPGGLFSWCRDCQRLDSLRRRQENRGHTNAIAMRSYEKNRAKRLPKMKEAHLQRMADPVTAEAERTRNRKRSQADRLDNPERHRQAAADSRARHHERNLPKFRLIGRERYKRDPAPFLAAAALQRARRRAAPGAFTGQDLNAAFKRQNGKCFYCSGKVGRGHPWQADHFIPISRGGTNHPENIVIACEPCNRTKYNKMPWEWMPERFAAQALGQP